MIRSSPPPPFPPLFLFVTLCFQFFQNNYRVSSGFLRFSIKSQLPCCLSGCFFFFIFSSLAISSIVFHFIRLALTQIEIHCGGSPNPIACVHLSQPLCTSRIHNGFIMPDAFISLQSFFFSFFFCLNWNATCYASLNAPSSLVLSTSPFSSSRAPDPAAPSRCCRLSEEQNECRIGDLHCTLLVFWHFLLALTSSFRYQNDFTTHVNFRICSAGRHRQ